jgi:hypothetical protein
MAAFGIFRATFRSWLTSMTKKKWQKEKKHTTAGIR